jgi:protein O-mannosyl-transferase
MSRRARKRFSKGTGSVSPAETPSAASNRLFGPNHRNDFLICFLLAASALLVFAQAGWFGFINYDDPDYVTNNFHVRNGLNAGNVVWAFTSGYASNWFPLTWLSHMADCQFFGLESGLHHLSNVFLHLLSTLILYLSFRRMTGAYWPSAFTAFVFGTHPLHVESVAWISERKDVLSAFCWMLTLWNYARYAERPNGVRYILTLITFSLGLMSKPMVVTLPFVLLLLDFWPLRRLGDLRRAILEKIPFVILSVVVSIVTYIVQYRGGAVIPLGAVPLIRRLGNALQSYLTYLLQTFFPVRLSVFYPFPDHIPVWKGVAAAIVLIAITALVLRRWRDLPWLGVGWLWYLGALVPVIGLVQVGNQAHADRYTYIPMIGLTIMLAWGSLEIWKRRSGIKRAILVAGCTVCVATIATARIQMRYWRDSESLFRHALAVTEENYVAWNGLGQALNNQGHFEEAARCYREAIRARPADPDGYNNLGEVLLSLGDISGAAAQAAESLRLNPNLPEAHINLGAALNRMGRVEEAAAQYREALRLQPDNAAAHTGAAAILEDEGRKDQARAELEEAIRLQPDYAPAHYNLGRLLGQSGQPAEAAREFARAIRLQPGNAENHLNLGLALAARGNLEEATVEFLNAVRLDPGYAAAHFNLGTAYAQSGRMDDAIREFSEALRLRPDFPQARESLENAVALRSQSAGPGSRRGPAKSPTGPN